MIINPDLKIYCDGACSGNPGPGAWAYVVFSHNNLILSASGSSLNTTNNRMELIALTKVLEAFNGCEIFLDSKYVQDGLLVWSKNWKKNGWKNSKGDPVLNLELWQYLLNLFEDRDIKLTWQKGHDNSLHDHADKLARESIIYA